MVGDANIHNKNLGQILKPDCLDPDDDPTLNTSTTLSVSVEFHHVSNGGVLVRAPRETKPMELRGKELAPMIERVQQAGGQQRQRDPVV